jgi:hypothetical protein
MAALRMALILLLSVGLDVMPASALESLEGLEALEEYEEAFHRSRGRRAARPPAQVKGLAAAWPAPVVFAPTVPREPHRARRPAAGGPARKVPPRVSDSASASEDHPA